MQDNTAGPPVPPANDTATALSAVMSEHAFAVWGIDEIAYIKHVSINGEDAWAICAADGSSLAVVRDRALAFAAALQNDRLPLSVH
jgi:hypothetical protein